MKKTKVKAEDVIIQFSDEDNVLHEIDLNMLISGGVPLDTERDLEMDFVDAYVIKSSVSTHKSKNLTRRALLERMEEASLQLKHACEDYWANIKLPPECMAVPFVRTQTALESKEAEKLVDEGLWCRLGKNTYGTQFQENHE